jgi:hypothetical protein
VVRLKDIISAELAVEAAEAEYRAYNDPREWSAYESLDKRGARVLNIQPGHFERRETLLQRVTAAQQQLLAVKRGFMRGFSMQQIEPYRLLGIPRRPPSPSVQNVMVEEMLRRYHDRQAAYARNRRAEHRIRPAPEVAQLGKLETRPLEVRPRRGDIKWALRYLNRTDPAMVAEIRRNPEVARQVLARLDDLIDQLESLC